MVWGAKPPQRPPPKTSPLGHMRPQQQGWMGALDCFKNPTDATVVKHSCIPGTQR